MQLLLLEDNLMTLPNTNQEDPQMKSGHLEVMRTL